MTDYKYDVAISCLSRDEPVARQLHGLLQPKVRSLFLYSENQKDVMGEDGVVFFGSAFSQESRVVVIVYREGWGKTKWTAVEERAISTFYFDAGWKRVFVYSLDGTKPAWLPPNYLYGAGDELSAVAAVIERKVLEEGGHVASEDPTAMAARIHDRNAARLRREAKRHTEAAANEANRQVAEVRDHLKAWVEGQEGSRKWVWYGVVMGVATVGTDFFTVGVHWRQRAMNSVAGSVLEILTTTASPGPGGFAWREGRTKQLQSCELRLAEDEATWLWTDGGQRHFSASTLADEVLRVLLAGYESQTDS